jgi:hypothetical protein
MDMNRLTIPCSLLLTLGTSACTTSDSQATGTGLELRAFGDVDGFHYSVVQVDCPTYPLIGDPHVAEAYAPVRDSQSLPGNLEAFKNKPFAEGSMHGFADMFFTLDAGCYNVTATPMGAGADQCSAPTLAAVQVDPGATTERLLISQCLGVDKGALDAIAATNHDPVLDRVYFPESKFTCATPTSICVEVSDPDNDPLAVEVTFEDGVPCAASAFAMGDFGNCATITCTSPGSYAPKVTVFDLAYNTHDELVHIEDLLASFGTVGYDSRAELVAQIHVDGHSGYHDVDDDGFGDEAYFGCEDPGDLVPTNGDCNDDNAEIHPGATEICDGIDNDCNGETDEGLTVDGDGDGFSTPESCHGSQDDCDDGDAAVNPSVDEVCDDGIDNNCDEAVDEGCVLGSCDENIALIATAEVNPGGGSSPPYTPAGMNDGIGEDCSHWAWMSNDAGRPGWATLTWELPQSVASMYIDGEDATSPACGVVGRDIATAEVQYLDSTNTWVTATTISGAENYMINFASPVVTTSLRLQLVLSSPGNGNSIVHEWYVWGANDCPTPAPN